MSEFAQPQRRIQTNHRFRSAGPGQRIRDAADSETSFTTQHQTAGVGNQTLQHLLRTGVIHAKLRIGQAGDRYEQEADRIADVVMRMPDTAAEPQRVRPEPTRGLSIQRMCSACREEELAQPKRSFSAHVPREIESPLERLSGGTPLPESARTFFESRFGFGFGDVRVHTDTAAAESARGINALAYTLGNHVVFSAGQYAPETTAGRTLLAHELTHVVQQTASPTSAAPAVQRLEADDDLLAEDEATALGPHEQTCGEESKAYVWESKGEGCKSQAMIQGFAQACATKCKKEGRIQTYNAKAQAACTEFCRSRGETCTGSFSPASDCASYECRARPLPKGVCPQQCPMYDHCLQLPTAEGENAFNCRCSVFEPS